jgi:hypothetical protein
MGREVLLDNSIFELGEAYDADKFASRIQEIKPTYYVVPDVLEDADGTMKNWLSFDREYRYRKNVSGLAIGVVQGKTYQDLVDCYRFISRRADYIAISFDYSYYLVTGEGESDLGKMASGRTKLIRSLIQDGIWNHNKPHHLLGCSLAKEFAQYRGIPSIRSCDTSNPVTAALDGERYIKGIGLHNHKPAVKLADRIDEEFDHDTENLIYENTEEFSRICHGY